ncbi:MAG: ATP-binding protein [Flavobacteriales bacterium]|nr:ATP-binding protein [Flavobacteriales bacterium]
MKEFTRKIAIKLEEWKQSDTRKPLIIRGARQVGKTTVVITFSKSYKNFIHLNLERKRDLEYFEKYDDVKTIIDHILLANGIPSNEMESTLLFIDEIQESTKAIHLLRYFYEDLPELHVITAGSLLEFALSQVKGFPVGRIQYLYMHPLNFEEFINVMEHEILLEELHIIPVRKAAHSTLLRYFNKYVIVGGMPEVLAQYRKTNSLSDLITIYGGIWTAYKEDVEKYARNETEKKVLRHIMETGPGELDKRIKFQNFGNSSFKSREVSQAMTDLDMAKVIRLIYPTSSTEFPIRPNIRKSPRLQFLDTGIINHTLNIQADLLGFDDLSSSYKGALIPHIITQELISLSVERNDKPNFWVREKSQASSEVDLVVQHGSLIIPIEIKSGKIGKLKSLHQYVERCNHPYAVRMYAGEFAIEEHTTPGGTPYLLMNLPYYLGTKIPEYIEYFVSNYQQGKETVT